MDRMMIKRVYFDTCAIQRPLDDLSQLRIYLESEAILAILRLVEDSQVTWISSDILMLEISYITSIEKKMILQDVLKLAPSQLKRKKSTKLLTEQLMMAESITALDAAHVAIALENEIDYFCTSDDKLLKKIKNSAIIKTMQCLSPLELIEELTQ
ncbi:MAG: nucleic acid-binding protein [Acinetobacter sp.]|nr:MAG: nucleic acid-binding protein [Acinetobacter sp.]